MGSAIAAGLSMKKYREGKKDLAAYRADVKKAEAQAKANTPAEAQVADTEGIAEADAKKRRGVQATYVAQEQERLG